MVASKTHSILIVEDERIVAKDIQQTLVGMGYDAFAIASSADEALGRVSERCPDLVLMDIRIKGRCDGIETAALLRDRFGVPVVYLTAHADEATIERANKTEPYGYLMKPVKSAELRSAIEVSIHKHEMEKRGRERNVAAAVAHEVNEPLALILANASFVLQELRHQMSCGTGDLQRLGEAISAQSELEAAARRIAQLIAGPDQRPCTPK